MARTRRCRVTDAERAQTVAPASQQFVPGGSATAVSLLPPERDRVQSPLTFPAQVAAREMGISKHRAADVFGEKLSPEYLANRLDELAPSFLSDYLKQAGYAELGEYAGCAPAPQLLSALYRHLAPARLIGGDPAGVERLDAQSLERLMRHVMRELGFYGARDGQAIAPAFQRQVLIRLISRWANGCLQTPARIAGYSWSAAARHQRTLTQIKEEVASRLQAFGLPPDVAGWAGALLLAGAEPALARADTPGELRYGSLEWADLQTGIDTATALGHEHAALTYTELVALARTSDIAAREHPGDAAALLGLQVRTALVFAGMSIEADGPQSDEYIEQALMALNDARTARWEAVQHKLHVLKALEAPLPMRRRMALQNLADRNIDPRQRFLVSAGVRDPDPEQLPHPPIEEEALTLYLDGRGDLVERGLPDVDKAFERAFKEYTSHYQRAVKTLFDDVVQSLPEQDRSFWQQGQAQILVPDVALDLKGMPSLSQWPLRMRELTALVAVSYNGKTRHYLVSAAGGDNAPIRLIAADLPRTLADVDREKLDQALLPYADDLFTNAGDMQKARHRVWHFRSDGEPGPATSVVAQRFTRPVAALREQAYTPTVNQQIGQVVRQTLLSLIPFYDCVTEARAGNAGGTALSCGLDVVSLIPVLGTGIKLGVGAGKLSIRLGSAALLQLARNGLSRQTLHMVSAQLASPLAKYGASGGKALARATAQWLDPGFALLGKMPAAARRAFMSTLRRWSDLKPLAARIHASQKRQPYRFDAQAGVWQIRNRAVIHDGGRQFAQIDGRAFELIDLGNTRHVPVLRVEGDGDARFALVDPRSGLAYGPQWVPAAAGFETLGDYRVRLAGKLPAADERGIIRFRQRDYIQVDGQYYPVRHDDAWQTWRIRKENNPNGYPIPVRYDAGHGIWLIHDEVGLRGGSPPEPPSLADLPAEMISEIAHRLSDADIERLSLVNHRLRDALAQERTVRLLLMQVRQVRSLEEFQALLRAPEEGIQVIRSVRMSLQESPLAVLSHRLAVLPDNDRLAAFNLIHEAVTAARFPMAHRAAPLTALAGQIAHLHEGDRLRSFNLIHNDLTIATFPLPRRAAPHAALAGQIDALDEIDRPSAFSRVLEEAGALPMEHLDAPLAALTEQIFHLPMARQLEAVDGIIRVAATLDAERHAGQLERLARRLDELPEEQHVAFDRVFRATVGLPAEHRAMPLAALAERIGWLPDNRRQAVFNSVRREIVALPQRYRYAPLLALVEQFEFLPVPQLDLFVILIRSSVMAVPQHRVVLLRMLAERIRCVALPSDRGRAWRSVLSQVERLPETLPVQLRATAHTALARSIQSIPSMADRLEPFNLLFHAIMRLSPQHRAAPLMSLAETISFLPVLERPDAFDRIRASLAASPAE